MKKEQIIEVARELFHKFGFKKVSMDEIAQKSGVTKKTIYMYFGNKEELLKYFIKEEIENMKKIVKEVEDQNLEFFETVNQAIYKLLKYERERSFLNLIQQEALWSNNQIIIQNLKLIDEQIQTYIRNKLETAKEKGYIFFEDIEITTFLIYKMYIALIVEWNNKSKKIDEKMLADNISKILKNGLRREIK